MKKTIAMLVACIFFAVAAHAEEPKKEALSTWEKIRNKIEKITPKQKPTVTTAVGGVRGAQGDEQELYWKGEEKPQAISAEEIEQFSAALQLAESGGGADATAAFQQFVDKYPQSSLVGDAQTALVELDKGKASTQAPEDFTPPELPDFKVGM